MFKNKCPKTAHRRKPDSALRGDDETPEKLI
jgi:hypothetical protein